MSRVGKRRRRVALAEANLMVQRGVLREELARFRTDAAAAATPRRIVAAGALLGGLVGLLQGRRRAPASADAPTRRSGGSLGTIIQMFRLVSMAAPLLAPLMRMADSEAAADDAAGAGAAPTDDPNLP